MRPGRAHHDKPHHPHWPLAAILFGFILALGLLSVHEPSTWIRIKTGARIVAERAIPRVDAFSYGAAGAPWTTHSWLSDVLFAKLDALGGPRLLAAVKGAAVAWAFALMLPINHGSPIAAATLLALGGCAAWAGLAETPAAFDFLFFSLFVRLLRPRHRFRWRDAALVVALTGLWANLHGASAPLALWLAGLKVFKTSLRTAARERLGYWTMMLACLIVFSWNPHGYGLLRHAFADASSAAWPTPLVSLCGLLLAAGLASCWVTLQEEFVTTLAAAAVLLLSLALPGLRPLAALAACPVAALALGHVLRPRDDTWPRVLRWSAIPALLLAVYAQAIARPLAPSGGYGAPALSGAVHFLSVNGARGRMFNDPDSGAELIGLADRPVFSDQREGVYTDSFRRDALNWPRLFGSLDSIYLFDYAVVRNRRAGAPAEALDRDPRWRLAYADDRALVYVKADGASAGLAAGSPFARVAPSRLWPDVLDPDLADPGRAGAVLAELDRWAVQAPDCAQALLWKSYALARLGRGGEAARLLDLALERPGLSWDPELQAQAARAAEALGRTERARALYRRAESAAGRLGDGLLLGELRSRPRP